MVGGPGVGRSDRSGWKKKKTRIGFDYVHSGVDDHNRFAVTLGLAGEKGETCAGFLARAVAQFHAHGVTVDAIMTDNHWSYTRSRALATFLDAAGIAHVLIRPHCPWQNGKVERFNRTLQTEWAYRQVFTSNQDRTQALAPWLADYKTRRRHHALGGQPPISRLSPT